MFNILLAVSCMWLVATMALTSIAIVVKFAHPKSHAAATLKYAVVGSVMSFVIFQVLSGALLLAMNLLNITI